MSTQSQPRPRPILKRVLTATRQSNQALPFATCATHAMFSPHVHFPPTPSMVASTHPVHSPTTYDRKPIVVSPNSSLIPTRGDRKLLSPPADFETARQERGRPRDGKGDSVKGSYFHPRAYEACQPESLDLDEDVPLSPPLLMRDCSSDDYDSDLDYSDDEAVTTPPDPKLAALTVDNKPALPDADTTQRTAPSRGRRSNYGMLKPVEELPRPHLLHASGQPSIHVGCSREFSPHLDEGCLGGF